MNKQEKVKVGFMLNNIGPNQFAHYMIKSANAYLLENSKKADVVAFVENISFPIAVPNFATMNMSECFDYNGTLVATNLQAALKMIGSPGAKRKIFYVWDLEWTRYYNKQIPFTSLRDIYCNPNIELVARSQTHADLIELCWRAPIGIVEDANFDQFYTLLTSEQSEPSQ